MSDSSHTKLSVALCTYKGERFLEQQLTSLAAQTRLPDELIVCDDASPDRTCEIIERFARTAPFPVNLIRNEHNLGVAKNFEQAIQLCRGTLIALCDQDDIWRVDKLALCEQALTDHPDAVMVFSDAELIDDSARSRGERLWDAIGFDARQRVRFRQGQALDVLLGQSVVTGATMMFHADFRDVILPISPNWIHDGWIALFAVLYSHSVMLETPIMQYRLHDHNHVGVTQLTLNQQINHALKDDHHALHQRLQQYEDVYSRVETIGVPVSDLSQVKALTTHLRRRSTLPQSVLAKLPIALRELMTLRYHRYSAGFRSFAKDLLL